MSANEQREFDRSTPAENCLLGAILIDNNVLYSLEQLNEDEFESKDNRAIFMAARELVSRGRKADPWTVCRLVNNAGYQISIEYLINLMQQTPSAKKAATYRKIMKHERRIKDREASEISRMRNQVSSLTGHNARLSAKCSLLEQEVAFWRAQALDQADKLATVSVGAEDANGH